MPHFIEIIGEYEGGESVDVLLNVDHVLFVRPDCAKESESAIQLVNGALIRALEPYADVVRKIGGK